MANAPAQIVVLLWIGSDSAACESIAALPAQHAVDFVGSWHTVKASGTRQPAKNPAIVSSECCVTSSIVVEGMSERSSVDTNSASFVVGALMECRLACYGNALDLDIKLTWLRADGHKSASRKVLREVFAVDLVNQSKICGVSTVHGGFDNFVERRAGSL